MSKIGKIGLSFDDVLIIPSYSEVNPAEASVKTRLSSTIQLNIPILSSAMDTVTESAMAIALARLGGLGIIHNNLPIDQECAEVTKVKRTQNGMITEPITILEDTLVSEAKQVMSHNSISGIPVIGRDKKIRGIITSRDIRFESRSDLRVRDVMTPRDRLITGTKTTRMDEAKAILQRHRVEKLPIVTENDELIGLITVKDLIQIEKYPAASYDHQGRLRVGAAVNPADTDLELARRLLSAGADVLVIDTAHGDTKRTYTYAQELMRLKSGHDFTLIVGNIVSEKAARRYAQLGVDAIKVGIGPGSICTTRVVTGCGLPQLSAIIECAKGIEKSGTTLIADGGIKFSGDIVKAIGAGAHSVMIGSLLAGTNESPGQELIIKGEKFKYYRGMGSEGALLAGSQRYGKTTKTVAEGIEGRVPHRGDVEDVIEQLIGGLRSGMGYAGCHSIEDLRIHAKFRQITNSGLKESHVHDVIMIKEARNYSSQP